MGFLWFGKKETSKPAPDGLVRLENYCGKYEPVEAIIKMYNGNHPIQQTVNAFIDSEVHGYNRERIISLLKIYKDLKQNFKSYILLGLVIIVSGGLTCVACYFIGKGAEANPKEFVAMLAGLLSGALTSTPAFSAAKATVDPAFEAAVTVGYGIAYLFGVVGVVLFVQLIPKITRADMDAERAKLVVAETSKKTEYKGKLFDMDNYGSNEWKPYVDVDIGALSGSGVPGMANSKLEKDNIAWVILQNIQSEIADVIPVLVTRNADYQTLGSSLEKFEGSSSTEVKCGNGSYTTPFGNKAWIVVRKGGAAQVLKAKYSRLSVIFNRQGFDNSNLKNKLKFLEL